MAVNRHKPDLWKPDIAQSLDMYNDWFMRFAPQAFRETRVRTSQEVENTLAATANLTDVQPSVLRQDPGVLASLRMCTCPPLARDRLIGLAGVPKDMVNRMKSGKRLPFVLKGADLDHELRKIGSIIERMADRDIFPWLDTHQTPTPTELERAASIVADRLCGAATNPTNACLLLYPKPALARKLRNDPDLAVKIWRALDRISQHDRIQEGRVYGGGLYELEPKDLSNVSAAEIAALVSEHADDAFEALGYRQLALLMPGWGARSGAAEPSVNGAWAEAGWGGK